MKILIEVRGGVVCNVTAEQGIEYCVVDYDNGEDMEPPTFTVADTIMTDLEIVQLADELFDDIVSEDDN